MIKNNYGIKDTCVKEFINTFNAENDDVAIRSFKRDCLKAPDSVPVDDFILCRLGTFDSEKGIYQNDFKFLASATEFFKEVEDSCNTIPIPIDQK